MPAAPGSEALVLLALSARHVYSWVYTPLCAALSAATLWLVWVPGDARAGLSADRDHQLFACAIASEGHRHRRQVGAVVRE